MMDNRIFNVNGEGSTMLLSTLELVFAQRGDHTKCKGWFITKKHGMVLTWITGENHPKISSFPGKSGLTAEQVLPIVVGWLISTEDTQDIEMKGWDADADHDGENGMGWRVFCEDWGHVADEFGAICAVKPAYMWYGK